MASVEFSHLSVSHFRENSRAVEPRFSRENKVRDAALMSAAFSFYEALVCTAAESIERAI